MGKKGNKEKKNIYIHTQEPVQSKNTRGQLVTFLKGAQDGEGLRGYIRSILYRRQGKETGKKFTQKFLHN